MRSIVRIGIVAVLLVLAAVLVGSVFLFRSDGTVQVEITQAMIDGVLARKFPKEKTYLKIIRVTYLDPAAVFVPQEDKVRLALAVRVEIGIKGFGKAYQGDAAITTRVGYRRETHEFLLQEARVETLNVPKLSERDLAILREGLNLVAEEWAQSITVYQLSDRDTPQKLAKLVLKRIEIRGDKAVATLGW